MKVLNRPMFRYGGPIKEGIMSGIKEPRQKYQEAGQVFKNVKNILTTDEPRGDVLQGAAELGIASPYKRNVFKPYMKKVVTKPTDLSEMDIATAGGYGEIEKPYIEYQKIPKYIEDVDGDGIRDLNPEYTKNKTFLNDIFGGPYEQKTNPEFKSTIKTGPAEGTEMPPMLDQSGKMGAGTIDEVIQNKGKIDDEPIERAPLKKERVNSILEGLGYDRAQKNALYDAMIKAGQRISRTGLGAENLVSDVIAETSQSYDKPEKLREAANLMDVQQQLKLDQIEASKDNRPNIQKLAEYYQSEEGGGYSEDIAIRMARNLPTKISEYFTASKAATDQGKTRDATRAATEDGLFGSGVAYKGKIDVAQHDSLKEFLVSDDLKTRGDGVYNVKGEAIVIKDGQVVSRLVIQAQDDKKGWFTK